MEIDTKRLQIRFIREGDWTAVRQIWMDQTSSEYGQYDNEKNTEEAAVKARVKRWTEMQGDDHLFFAVCLKEEPIGFINFNKCIDSYEISYGFLKKYQGNGYACEATLALLDDMRKRGIRKFSAGTGLKNLPSVALLNAVGFELTGTEKVSFYKDAFGEDIYFDGGIFRIQ